MPMDPEVLTAAKSADKKLIFVPLLLFCGRSFGIVKFFLHIFSDKRPEFQLSAGRKLLLTLEVSKIVFRMALELDHEMHPFLTICLGYIELVKIVSLAH